MKLLRIEFLKLRSYVPMRIMLGIFLVLMPFGLYAFDAFLSVQTIEGAGQGFQLQLVLLPDFWYHLTYYSSWYNMLFGVIMIILTTNEFAFKTLRQNIIDGMRRVDFISAKLQLCGLLALMAGVYVTLVGLITIYSSDLVFDTPMLFDKMPYLAGYTFQVFWYACAGLLVGLIVKRAGLAILLYLFAIPADFFLNSILHWVAPVMTDVAPFSAIASVVDFYYIPPEVFYPMPDFALGKAFFVALAWLAVIVSAGYATTKTGDI